MKKKSIKYGISPDQRQKTMTKGILVAWLVVVVLVFSGFAFFSFIERRQVLERAVQDSRLIASRAAAHADRIFEGMDMALVALETLLGGDLDWDRIGADRAKWLILRRWANAIPVVPRLIVADANGRIRLHSDVFPAPPRSIAERGYFLRHRTEARDQAILGDPITGVVSGQMVLTLSRRLSSRDGSFNGVVVANISPEYFEQFYETLGIGSGSHVMVLRADGTILSHAPARAGVIGTKLDLTAMLTGIANADGAGFAPPASDADGIQRITAFRRLDRPDTYAVSSLAVDEVLVNWRRSTRQIFWILACSFAGLTVLLVRLLRHRANEISALQSQAASELRFRTLFEQAAVGVGLIETATGRFLQVNQKFCEIVGYTREETEQLDFQTITHPDDLGKDLAFMDRLRAGEINEYALEKRCIRRDGTVVWASLTVSRLLEPETSSFQHIAVVQDISGRKQAEEALRESEEIFSRFLQHSPIYVFFKDEAIRTIRLSSNYEKMLGRPVPELLGKTMDELFPSDIAKSMVADDLRILKEGKQVEIEEKLNGRFYSTVKFPIYRDGKAHYLAGFTMDITDRKRTEKALRESEERLKFALDGSNDGLWDVQMDTGAMYLSPRGCEILGWRNEDIPRIARTWDQLVHPDDLPATHAALNAYLQGQAPLFMVEQRLKAISGEWKWILTRGKVVERTPDGKPIRMVGTHTDITERRKLEDQLLQSQKMEAIGRLAGGIAHDFNNILTAIIGYASIAQMKMKADDPVRVNIDHILESANRAAALTQSLLAFSRKQVMNLRPVNVNEIIQRVEKFLQRIIGEDVEMKTMVKPRTLMVHADSGQIEQVLMNLATNARDAMPKGGVFTIETDTVMVDDDYISVHGVGRQGIYAVVSVSDTGEGMDETTRKRIFEPFYTTKEVGRGTGLGLSIVYGIVQQHNGFVNVTSEPGKGTNFKIYLPIVQTPVEGLRAREQISAPVGGVETILLAEDDEKVRELSRQVLQESGYTVIIATDGEEAVRMFLEQKDRIRLVILDVVMPAMTGDAAYQEMKKIRPDIKALFISGYTADAVHIQRLLADGMDFVQKPVAPTDFLKKVREVLDKK